MVYTSADIQVFYNIKKCIISPSFGQPISKLCFSFLWTASKQIEGIALVKWKTLAKPKNLGGWGIKNLEWFTKALAAKTLWRLLQNAEKIWSKVIVAKYCPDNSILE